MRCGIHLFIFAFIRTFVGVGLMLRKAGMRVRWTGGWTDVQAGATSHQQINTPIGNLFNLIDSLPYHSLAILFARSFRPIQFHSILLFSLRMQLRVRLVFLFTFNFAIFDEISALLFNLKPSSPSPSTGATIFIRNQTIKIQSIVCMCRIS